MNRKLLAFAFLPLLLLDARADTTCRLAAGNSLAFGSYDVLSPSPSDTLASVEVVCDRSGGGGSSTGPTVSVDLALGQGANGASVGARRLARTGGGDYLSYGLYRDVGRSAVWGFTTGMDTMSKTLTIHGKSAPTIFTIYGRIPAGQDVMAGSYADAVQVTVTP